MISRKKKTKKKLHLIILIGVMIILTFAWSDFIISKTNGFLLPIKLKIYQTNNHIHEFFNTFSKIDEIKEENKQLEFSIEEQKFITIENQELLKENQELRELLQMKERVQYEMIAADIIFIDSLNPYEEISINKGKEDGIEYNMAVVSPKGLVGRVKKVFDNYSQVELITSAKSYTSAIDRDENSLSILNGQGNDLLKLENVVVNSDIEIGDKIYTSGISEIYPKDLLLGIVQSIDKSDEIFKEITVKVPYKIFNLKHVIVMKKNN